MPDPIIVSGSRALTCAEVESQRPVHCRGGSGTTITLPGGCAYNTRGVTIKNVEASGAQNVTFNDRTGRSKTVKIDGKKSRTFNQKSSDTNIWYSGSQRSFSITSPDVAIEHSDEKPSESLHQTDGNPLYLGTNAKAFVVYDENVEAALSDGAVVVSGRPLQADMGLLPITVEIFVPIGAPVISDMPSTIDHGMSFSVLLSDGAGGAPAAEDVTINLPTPTEQIAGTHITIPKRFPVPTLTINVAGESFGGGSSAALDSAIVGSGSVGMFYCDARHWYAYGGVTFA